MHDSPFTLHKSNRRVDQCETATFTAAARLSLLLLLPLRSQCAVRYSRSSLTGAVRRSVLYRFDTMSSPATAALTSADATAATTPERGVLSTDVDAATGAVLIQSEDLPEGTPIVRGPNFDHGVNYDDIFTSFLTTGFQATNLALAIQEVKRMIAWRMSDVPLPDGETEEEQPVDRSKVKCTIFLAFTSNMMSSGVREIIRYLCQHRMVDVLITTCGGVEEDVMKVLHPHYMGSFHLDGRSLRRKGQNRIGNLLVPNKNYVAFESFLTPLLDDMCRRQVDSGVIQSPSSFIREMGKAINHPDSVYYWSVAHCTR